MSYAALIVFRDGKIHDSLEFRNAWGGAARIWDCLFKAHVPKKHEYDSWICDPNDTRLWDLASREDLEIFERAGWKCKRCGNAKQYLHLHHPKYDGDFKRQPWEYNDLEVICVTCHKKEHHKELDRLTAGDCYTITDGNRKGCVGIARQEFYQQHCHELHLWNKRTDEWEYISFCGDLKSLRKSKTREELEFLRRWKDFISED